MKKIDLQKSYSSKILLFGEYTVLHGSKALAMPFKKYSGQWMYDKTHKSRFDIGVLKQYLIKLYSEGKLTNFDFDDFEHQFSKGLAFDSNIPQGYGIGSSGSITAAVFDAFYKHENQISLDDLKKKLSRIESCYHGFSSGLDPLVSFLNQGILIHNNNEVELLDTLNSEINRKMYLVDTKIPRRTRPLVHSYIETRKESEEFTRKMLDIAIINDDLIGDYLSNKMSSFENRIKKLSLLQYNVLTFLIPDAFKKIWKEGLYSSSYSMKVNGAGGGGFLMVYLHDDNAVEKLKEIELIEIENGDIRS